MSSFRFTPCQAKALHLLMGDENVFLTGAAGTGKSELLRRFIAGKSTKEFPVLASTGAAATIIGGRTFHSFFGLGIMEGGRAATITRALQNKRLIRRIQCASSIVIDEISMLSGETLSTAEEIAKYARESCEVWGGMRIIVVGDFAQLPPVQPNNTEKDWAFVHPIWEYSKFKPALLRTTVRTSEPRLLSVLQSIRNGIIGEDVQKFLNERSNQEIQAFDGTRLFPYRASAETYNMRRLETIPHKLKSFRTLYEGGSVFVERLKKQCPIPDILHIKKDALVMLRKNDTSYPYEYVNGSLGKIVDAEEDLLHIKLLNGLTVCIEREEFSLLDGNGIEKAVAINFPITLAWGTTIHKAQGASIDKLMVHLTNLWESGHAYVALSRARSESGLFVEKWDEDSIFIDPIIQNFYKSVETEWNLISSKLPEEPPYLEENYKKKKREKNIPNHLRTLALLKKGESIDSIVEELGFKEETIISHIERLITDGKNPDIGHLMPDPKIFKTISEAFKSCGVALLKPVYDNLDGKFSYRDLRLVRILLNSNNVFMNS
ncbi:AAA family ATPase [Candidatus Peribacteria bacterium]|jgi:ATP-dependent DNA helicase PIF1|nr:AAA family ATPase [Candidatus Peribacteria bacterium]MBT4020907.1 AAA family ATPase [Candidatus Peribacteria bacterium]MBT4240651.1 AAA family ATPase [Candidatus Peribacteria bacterium]